MAEVQIEAIRALKKQRLEELLEALLRAERSERFEPGSVEIDGPSDEDVADGLRDNRVVISKAALTLVDDPLLPASSCEVRYSCKTNNNPDAKGKRWQDTIRDELDPGRAWDKAQDPKVDKEAARRKAKSRITDTARELYDHLASGGHYVIILGWRPGKLREFREELVQRLQWRLLNHDVKESDLSAQIAIYDANHLKRVVERLDRQLPASVRSQLGLDDAPFWQDWRQWTEKYSPERRRMDFVEDEDRKLLLGQLRAFMNQDQPDRRTIHVWGPPGVGKTRIVHELLSTTDNVESRVRYTADLRSAVTWLQGRPSMASDAVFVIDEVQPSNLRTTLLSPFNHASHDSPGARLIAIGPLHRAHAGEPPPLDVKPLADDEARELLREEMGDGDDRLERVVQLCGGFPLFILWLGRALRQNPELLANPGAEATGGTAEWDACVGVLDSPDADGARATLRAKSLLLTLLAPEGRWQRFDDREQDALARALSATWCELIEEGAEAEGRGLLRRLPDQSVYVSPQNLERMLLNHFFGGPGPGLDPEALRHRVPTRFPRLLERAGMVGANDRCKEKLADAQLRAAEACEDSEAWILWMGALLPASRVAPEHGATAIYTAIMRLGAAQIVEVLHYMTHLHSSLAHLSHRALSPEAFAAVEASLFTLVSQASPARTHDMFGLWTQLFAAASHMTRQPFELRSELLRRRIEANSPEHRVLAVTALARALDSRIPTRGWAPGVDDIDGPWEHERLPPSERVERLEHYWSALLDASEDEHSLDVAEAARRAVIDLFRQGLRAGLSVPTLELLSASVGNWGPDQRSELAEQLADTLRYDEDVLERRGAALRRAFDALHETLTPTTFAARLRAQVGSRHPGPWAIDADDRPLQEQRADEALARELIAAPELFTESVAWLLSARAVRAHPFTVALGRCDPSQVLLEPIHARVNEPAGLDFATAYLFGWSRGVGPARFDVWLSEAQAQRDPALLTYLLLRLQPNEGRVELLLELLERGSLPAAALRGVAYRSTWPSKAPLTFVDALIELLAVRTEQELAREGVALVASRLRRSTEELSSETRASVHQLLDRVTSSPLPAVVELNWSEAVSSLARSGDLSALRAAFERSVRGDTLDHPDHLIAALHALTGSGIGDELWPLVTDLLERQPNNVRLAVTLHETELLGSLSPQLVLDWVGSDRARGRTIATQLRLDADELHPVAHALLVRFGAHSPVAHSLASSAWTWGGRRPASRSDFLIEQARRARSWAEDTDEVVEQWATELAQQLEDEVALEHEDEARQLRYG